MARVTRASGDIIRVQREDGAIFQIREGELSKWTAANPGGHRYEGASASPAAVATGNVASWRPSARASATAAAQEAASPANFSRLNKGQLEEKAAELGVDISGAKTNAERAELLQAAGAGASQPAATGQVFDEIDLEEASADELQEYAERYGIDLPETDDEDAIADAIRIHVAKAQEAGNA